MLSFTVHPLMGARANPQGCRRAGDRKKMPDGGALG